MNSNDIINQFRDIQKQMNESDPLKDIPKDWVCVIHPQLEYLLMDEYSKGGPTVMPGFGQGYFGALTIETITKRKTYIMNSAPNDRVEYMDKNTFVLRYGHVDIKQMKSIHENEDE